MTSSDKVPGPDVRPAGFFRRRALVLLILVVLSLGVVLAWRDGRDRSTSSKFRSRTEQLDENDPNWRLAEIDSARQQLPEATNSAGVIRRVIDLLGDWHFPFPSEADFKIAPKLKLPLGARLEDMLDREIKAQATALATARRLAGMPRGRHRLNLAFNPYDTLLSPLQDGRKVGWLLHLDALNHAQKGDIGAALASCRAQLNVARATDDEPFAIAQCVRTHGIAFACNSAECALLQGEAKGADLAALQDLLAVEDKHPTLLVAIRGERALGHDLFTKLENGTLDTEAVLHTLDLESNWWLDQFGLSGDEIRCNHALFLEVMTRLVEVARLPAHEQASAEEKLYAELRAEWFAGLAQAAILRTIPIVSRNSRDKTARVRSLLVLLAVERYRLKHQAWPARLDDLVPTFLREVPADPYTGKPLRYHKLSRVPPLLHEVPIHPDTGKPFRDHNLADCVVVYSVGADGSDDGGNIDRSNSLGPGTDLGYRLWDVKARRQAPAP
jgi:hypothetical protein